MSNMQCCQANAARLFAAQHGVASRRQLLAVGISARMIQWRVEQRLWRPVQRAVYRPASAPMTWHLRVMAACLAVDGFASHRTAAALLGLDGLSPGLIEVVVARSTAPRLHAATVRRSRSLGPGDRAAVDGIPCTSVARTIVDLAAVLDEPTLEQALDSALREGKTSVDFLGRQLGRLGAGRPGAAKLATLLDDRRTQRPSESRREADVARLLVAAGLPRPVRQYELRDERGDIVARFDLAYPAVGIGIEFQSYRHHFGRQAWRRDQARANGATARGWLVFGVTEDHVRDQCVAGVVGAYRSRTTPKLPAA